MRINAHFGDRMWDIYHARWCRMITNDVVWIDTDCCMWGLFVRRGGECIIVPYLADRMLVMKSIEFIIVDPVNETKGNWRAVK